jgi:hypothetical protein
MVNPLAAKTASIATLLSWRLGLTPIRIVPMTETARISHEVGASGGRSGCLEADPALGPVIIVSVTGTLVVDEVNVTVPGLKLQ